MKTYKLGNVSKFIGFLLIYCIRKCFRIYKFASLPPNILGNLSEFVLTVLLTLRVDNRDNRLAQTVAYS